MATGVPFSQLRDLPYRVLATYTDVLNQQQQQGDRERGE